MAHLYRSLRRRRAFGVTALALLVGCASPLATASAQSTSSISAHSAATISAQSASSIGAQSASSIRAQSATSAQDRAFMTTIHQGNLAEIAAGGAAERQGASAGVRAMGARLIADHSRLDANLRALAASLNVPLPTTPSAAQQQELARIEALSGSAFDQAWISSQITGHENALAAIRQEITQGENPQVIQAARTAEPVVLRHLRMLRALNAG